MPMKNPAHPGALLKDDLSELGLTVAEAAEGLGVTRQQLYKVIKGESAVTPEMAVRLEMGVGSTADLWLRMQAAYDLAQLRNKTTKIKIKRLGSKTSSSRLRNDEGPLA